MAARLNYVTLAPELFRKLNELSLATKKAGLDATLVNLINIRVSQMNGCAFCVDMHGKEAKIHGERELRIYHVPIWRESPLFTDKEKAALEWAEAVTHLGPEGVPDDIYDRVRTHFSEKEIAELTFVIGVINFWNRLAVPFRVPPGAADKIYGLEKAGLS